MHEIMKDTNIPNLDPLLAEGFRNVDGTSDEGIARCLHCLEFIRNCSEFQSVRKYGHEQLSINGDVSVILEIGCGLGYDCVEFAQRLRKCRQPASFKIIGVDISQNCLNEAKIKAAQFPDIANSMEFIRCDVTDLSSCSQLLPKSVDRVYEERTLQHIRREQCSNVIGQISNVLKPNGTFVSVEPNWELFTLWPGDKRITRKLQCYWADSFNYGDISLNLPGLLREHGFKDISVTLLPVRYSDFNSADLVYDLKRTISNMFNDGLISEAERNDWLIAQTTSKDNYYCILIMSVISAILA